MLYKLSRLSKLHNFFRIFGNRLLWMLPVSFKYGRYSPIVLMKRLRLPYKDIKNGSTIIQLGAPWDILKAGRSRSIHFSKLVGKTGKVIVIEPDEKNVLELNKFIQHNKIDNIIVVPKGAWSTKTKLRFLIDDAHPASNLIEDVYNSSRTDYSKYRIEEIDVDSLENILIDLEISRVNLLSITTNGAEAEILNGVKNISNQIDLISIVGDPNSYPIINDLGFEFKSEDDRGYLYKRSKIS